MAKLKLVEAAGAALAGRAEAEVRCECKDYLIGSQEQTFVCPSHTHSVSMNFVLISSGGSSTSQPTHLLLGSACL